MQGVGDAHPKVRWASCQALGQLCTDLCPELQVGGWVGRRHTAFYQLGGWVGGLFKRQGSWARVTLRTCGGWVGRDGGDMAGCWVGYWIGRPPERAKRAVSERELSCS